MGKVEKAAEEASKFSSRWRQKVQSEARRWAQTLEEGKGNSRCSSRALHLEEEVAEASTAASVEAKTNIL